MITIVRLRDYAPRQNHTMRSYTSSFGNLYREGQKGFRRVDNLAELNELRQHAQFEIHQFPGQAELDLFLDGEAQKTYARQGVATKPPVTPVVSNEKIDRKYDDAKRAKIAAVLGGQPATTVVVDTMRGEFGGATYRDVLPKEQQEAPKEEPQQAPKPTTKRSSNKRRTKR